jgi:hypothetical protein
MVRTSKSVLNKLENAPNPRNKITANAIPVAKPIWLNAEGK